MSNKELAQKLETIILTPYLHSHPERDLYTLVDKHINKITDALRATKGHPTQ